MSSMLACTAAVTEIQYNDKDNYELDVEFLSREDWQKEITVLFQDIRDDDGDEDQHDSHSHGRNDPVTIARAKVS